MGVSVVWCCFLVVISTLAANGQAVDFYEHHGEFEYIYHNAYKLLLTVKGDWCFFTSIPDYVMVDQFRSHFKEEVKEIVSNLVLESRRVELASLAQVRDAYNDRLADYHCLNKTIYILHLDFVECSFEPSSWMNPFCAWTPSLQHPLQWWNYHGSTPSVMTGPEKDHTMDSVSGWYLYMEGNDGVEGDSAVLVSPVVSTSRDLCLKFWYNMYGSDVGKLQLSFIKTSPDPDLGPPSETALWSKEGNQGQGWKAAQVSITSSARAEDNNVKLLFQAIRGGSHLSDIAIDDISSSVGLCPYSLLECSFEAGTLCEWRNRYDSADQMDWKMTSGASSHHPLTGPITGHGGSGSYVFLDGDDGQPGYVAILQSTVLYLDTDICLQFYYYLGGAGVAGLEVILADPIRLAMHEHKLWEINGDHGQTWHEARVTITSPDPATPLQVLFRATRGHTAESDVAVDDITAVVGACDQQHT